MKVLSDSELIEEVLGSRRGVWLPESMARKLVGLSCELFDFIEEHIEDNLPAYKEVYPSA